MGWRVIGTFALTLGGAAALVAACGLDAEGTAVRDGDASTSSSGALPPSAEAGPDGWPMGEGGPDAGADAPADASPDADAGCPFLCNGVCVQTCSVCAGQQWGCGNECVDGCSSCAGASFECMPCVAGSGVPMPTCSADRDVCQEGANACACATRNECPSSQQVCSAMKCLTCNRSTGNLGLKCKNGDDCQSDGECD
jgi:hypothetical protein